MRFLRTVTLCLAGSLCTAQTAPSQPDTGCELHVIPLAKAAAVSNTDPLKLGLAGKITTAIFALKDPEAATKLIVDNLGVEPQQRIITELDPPKLLGISARMTFDIRPDAYLIPPKEMKSRGRLTDSTSPCYKELIVLSNYIYKDTLTKKFYTWSFYRTFSTKPVPDYVANKPISFPLHAFPPKSEAQLSAAIKEITAAFRENVRMFLTRDVKRP